MCKVTPERAAEDGKVTEITWQTRGPQEFRKLEWTERGTGLVGTE